MQSSFALLLGGKDRQEIIKRHRYGNFREDLKQRHRNRLQSCQLSSLFQATVAISCSLEPVDGLLTASEHLQSKAQQVPRRWLKMQRTNWIPPSVGSQFVLASPFSSASCETRELQLRIASSFSFAAVPEGYSSESRLEQDFKYGNVHY